MNSNIILNLHLISDLTCETVISVARAALEHFTSIEVNEFVWSMIDNKRQIDKIISSVKKYECSFVMYTMTNDDLRGYLKEKCRELNVPCIPVLSRIIREISSYLNVTKDTSISINKLDEDYFTRIDAINYTIAHDDGQNLWDIERADIIITGVSRTSKSPTSIYLAYRGYRVVNIPFVTSLSLPVDLPRLKNKLIIGLTINIDRLIQIRKNRLQSMKDTNNYKYIDYQQVKEEIKEAKKICHLNSWPIIDVTQRSVEEIAATIIQYFNKLHH